MLAKSRIILFVISIILTVILWIFLLLGPSFRWFVVGTWIPLIVSLVTILVLRRFAIHSLQGDGFVVEKDREGWNAKNSVGREIRGRVPEELLDILLTEWT